MHGLVALFLGVIMLAIILLVVGLGAFLSPCHHVKGDCGVDHLNDDGQHGDHCGRVGCFNDSRSRYDCDADGSSIHGYAR